MPDPAPLHPVRRARPVDVPDLVRLINLAYRVEDVFIVGDRIDAEGVLHRLTRPGSSFLVIDDPAIGTLVAAVHVVVEGERGLLALLSVDPRAQRRGLGGCLVAAVEAHCRGAGCRHLDLEVVDLRLELQPFYRRLGFVAVGTAPFPEPGKLRRPAAMIRMTKRLDAAPGRLAPRPDRG